MFKSIARDPGAPDSTRATAERKASAVARFQSSFKEGEAAVTSFQGARAVQSLEDALRADRQLGGGQSRRVYPLLSTAYTFKAKQSVTNKSYSRAMKFVRKSLAMDPTNQEAKGLRRILQDKASVLLNEAIAARNSGDTAKAERLLQTVLGIAEEGSSLYMKAWKALESR